MLNRCSATAVWIATLLLATTAAAAEPKVAERWALLVGVDDYAYAEKLKYCGADQFALSKQLIAAGFPADHVFILHDKSDDPKSRPSLGNVERHLKLVLSLADQGDLILVAFSGHGVHLNGKSYLCPADATLDDPKTMLALDDVYGQLQDCAAAFKLVVVDACRNDPRPGGSRSMTATVGTRALAKSLQELKMPEGVVLLNSCAPGEVSWEDEKFGHGVFMHFLLDGLKGPADVNRDGAVSLNELQSYAGTRTKTYVANRFSVPQRPFFRGDLSSEAMEHALIAVSLGSAALDALQLAKTLESQRRTREALTALDEYFAAKTADAGSAPYELLQRLLTADGRAADYLPKLEALLKNDTSNSPLRYALGMEYRQRTEFEKAVPYYDDLLRYVAQSDNRPERLVSLFDEILRAANGLDVVGEFIGELVGDAERFRVVAAAAVEAATHDRPGDVSLAALVAAELLLRGKRYREAGEHFEAALRHDPELAPKIFEMWGIGLIVAEQYSEAAVILRRAVEANVAPGNPVLGTYLAVALEMSGRTDEALTAMRKALESAQGRLPYEIRLPWIYYHGKRYREAAEEYEALLQRFTGDGKQVADADKPQIRDARLTLSSVYSQLGDVVKAEASLQAVLKDAPDDVGAMNDLAFLWIDQNKNLDAALAMINKAVAAQPNNAAYRDSLGWAYFKLGRFNDAVAELEIAVGRPPSGDLSQSTAEGEILDHLGDAYAKVGRAAEARQAWQASERAFTAKGMTAELNAVRKKLTP